VTFVILLRQQYGLRALSSGLTSHRKLVLEMVLHPRVVGSVLGLGEQAPEFVTTGCSERRRNILEIRLVTARQ
jgi:hypothetical protein